MFQSKVKVRRASISEPSDTDYEPRLLSSVEGGFNTVSMISSYSFNHYKLAMLLKTIKA